MKRIFALLLMAILLAACGSANATQTRTRAADGMVMVYVPAGEFLRGSTEAQVQEGMAVCASTQSVATVATCEGSVQGQAPQRRIALDAFWIDRTEVTNDQYRAFVGATGHQPPATCGWGDATYGDASKAIHPVVCVGWEDARAYCEWAGARLPTEAEWEKAARGADGRLYPWGNAFDGRLANYCDKNCYDDRRDNDVDDGHAQTAPVGSYPKGASPYGVLDMAGNVFEWVSDWYDEGYYAASPAEDPHGPDSGAGRVFRGGAWSAGSYFVRPAYRVRGSVTLATSFLGFRCAAISESQGR